MADRKLKDFPDLASKLSAPTKKSKFEQQKADAEAKRLREQAEAAAVYENFVKDFAADDDDGDDDATQSRNRFGDSGSRGLGRGGGFGSGPQRHFMPSGPQRKSGPGTLPGSFGPPPSRKRPFDTFSSQGRQKEQGTFKYDETSGPMDVATAFRQQEEDEEEAVQVGNRSSERPVTKPALQLTSLPIHTSQSFIESLIPSHLNVEGVRILPATGPPDRKAVAAVVTLAKETPVKDIDDVVKKLSDHYLGYGYYLSISRSFSTATGHGSLNHSHPFGAKPAPSRPLHSLSHAPPPEALRHGYGPPSRSNDGHGSGHFVPGQEALQVTVRPPQDIKELKLIHKTIEAIHEHGIAFEALLMTRSEVKKDPKWAWLWDARSVGGVYYRWRLWETCAESRWAREEMRAGDEVDIFDNRIPWIAPEKQLRFEFNTQFEDLVDDADYNTSDDGESGDEAGARRNQRGGPPREDDGQDFLSPLHRAQLTHLLTRLPSSTAKLRRGDVARITCFAIRHASTGAEDIVNMLISNIERPFSLAATSDARRENGDEMEGVEEDADKKQEREDPSTLKLIGLYLISDLLKESPTSGISQAWRYRALCESALKQRKVFEGLGRLEKSLQMGRMRGDRWKSRIKSLFDLWSQWSLFTTEAHKQFVNAFFDPQPTEEEKAAAAMEEKKKSAASSAQSKWKTLENNGRGDAPRAKESNPAPQNVERPMSRKEEPPRKGNAAAGDAMEGVTKEPFRKDRGKSTEGVKQDKPQIQFGKLSAPAATSSPQNDSKPPTAAARRQRPRAVDMFGDSDEDD